MPDKKRIIGKLFLSTLYLSAFTFGGGYVIVTLMKKKFVDQYHWLENEEMLDMIAIAQSVPGPVAVNASIVVGYKLAGLGGSLAAILGTVLPPFLIISVLSLAYSAFKENFLISQLLTGMQAGVAAVIAAVAYEMGRGMVQGKSVLSITIMTASFMAVCFFHVNAIYVVIFCILLGLLRALAGRKEGGGK